MAIDLTFDSVCKSVTDEYPDIAEDINTFSDIALILSVAAAAGPITMVTVAGTTPPSPALVALTAIGTLANLFAVKDKIPQTVERIIDRVMSRKDADPLHQMNRMERAYYLICYTAFFEALSCEKGLTSLLKKAKMKPDEKAVILTDAMKELRSTIQTTIDSTPEGSRGNPLSFQIDLPAICQMVKLQRERQSQNAVIHD